MRDTTTRAFEIFGASEERAMMLSHIRGRLRVLEARGLAPECDAVQELMSVVRFIESRSSKDKAEVEAMQ